jgi:transposase InsO family protein
MPWRVCSVIDERAEFVRLAGTGAVSIAELCRRFGISRETGHQLLRRHAALGLAGLADVSRRPHSSPRRTSSAMEEAVLLLRDRHPAWGGRKIARRLLDLGHDGVPSPSTVTQILRRHGRLDDERSTQHKPFQRFERSGPNALWQMDFKGHFALGKGRCHALTVLDDHCRYSLGLRACADERMITVRAELTAIFRRYGLPDTILADNGAPWGSTGHGTQTALGVWLMQVGVRLITDALIIRRHRARTNASIARSMSSFCNIIVLPTKPPARPVSMPGATFTMKNALTKHWPSTSPPAAIAPARAASLKVCPP